jgi:gamma-glutamyltranspeptidase/glutathione hydrolase
VERLVSKAYARERAATIDLRRRSPSADIRPGPAPGEHTTHVSIVDGRGLAVANTTTLNAGYGSGIVVTGGGFLLNNEMDDFSAKPGTPNLYGVVGAEANSVQPGKRMLSSMSPSFVFRPDGSLWLTLGSPGGPTIFTSVFQVIVNRIDYGLELEAAVAAPRFHHQWPPPSPDVDPIRVETERRFALSQETRAALREMGYSFRWRGNIGRVNAVELERGRAMAVTDPRGQGRASYP